MQLTRSLVIGALFAALASVFASAQTPVATVSPVPQLQFFDNNGKPLSGGQLCTYAAGTTTPLTSYQNANGTPNTNPIVLDASGRANVWIGIVAYKFVLRAKGSPMNCTAGTVLYTVDGVIDQGFKLRSDLSASNGSGNIGYQPAGGTVPVTVGDVLGSMGIYDIGYSDIATACNNASPEPLIVTKAWKTVATQTLNCNLHFNPGGSIQPATGATVTLSGGFTAAATIQIFDESLGIVKIPRQTPSSPFWWGAKGDGMSDDTMPILQAIAAAGASGVGGIVGNCIDFPAATYRISGQLDLPQGVVLCGPGAGGGAMLQALPSFTAPVPAGYSYGAMIHMGTATGANGVPSSGLRNISIDCGLAAIGPVGCSGIEAEHIQENTVIDNITVGNCTDGGFCFYGHGNPFQNLKLNEVTMQARAGATTVVPLDLYQVSGGVLSRWTIVGGAAGDAFPVCAKVRDSLTVVLTIFHFENCALGIDSVETNAFLYDYITGHFTVATILKLEDSHMSRGGFDRNLGINDKAGHDYTVGTVTRLIPLGSANGMIDNYPTSGPVTYGGANLWTRVNDAVTTDYGLNPCSTYIDAVNGSYVQCSAVAGQVSQVQIWTSASQPGAAVSIDSDLTSYTSGVAPQIAAPVGNYTAVALDEVILCDASSGPATITIPSPAKRRRLTIVKHESSANACTVTPATGTINAMPSYSLPSFGNSVTVVATDPFWLIIGKY
jgi:hypothetical protein